MVTSQRRTHGKIRGRHASRGVPPTNRYDSGSLARRTGATTWAQLFRYTVFDRDTIRAAYDEPYVYTMGRPGFILQHVVDAFAVQAANCDSSPIGVVFGLVGLYLHVEKQFSGHQVQQVHIKLGRRKREWPSIHFPEHRGGMTAVDVLAASAGPARDMAIDDWCRSVWTSFGGNRQTIIARLRDDQIS